MLGFAGTPGYLSPEVLRKEAYGKPVDIWACGEAGVLGEVGCTHKHCTRPTPGCPQLGAPSPPRPELLTQPWLLLRSPPTHCPPCARQSSLEKGQQVPGWGMDTGGAEAVWTTLAGLPPCQGRLPHSQCSGGGLPCEVGSGAEELFMPFCKHEGLQRGTLIDAGCGDGQEGVLEDPSVLMGLAGFGQ